MRKLFFLAAFGAAVVASGCSNDEKKDIAIVGSINLSGECSDNNSRPATWVPGDQIGVFVSSDGLPQKNLLYVPSQTAEDLSMTQEDGSKFYMFGDTVGDVALTTKGTQAGFKAGTHMVYAYYPYNSTANDVTAIPIPDLRKQDGVKYSGQTADHTLSFGYAEKKVEEYSAATVDLGQFVCPLSHINTASIPFENNALVGKKVVKIVVSTSQPMAYKNGTFNLVEKTFGGEGVNTIEYVCEMEIDEAWGGVGTSGGAKMAIAIPVDVAKTLTYTFKITLDDGSEYTASGVPTVNQYLPTNLNFSGKLNF